MAGPTTQNTVGGFAEPSGDSRILHSLRKSCRRTLGRPSTVNLGRSLGPLLDRLPAFCFFFFALPCVRINLLRQPAQLFIRLFLFLQVCPSRETCSFSPSDSARARTVR